MDDGEVKRLLQVWNFLSKKWMVGQSQFICSFVEMNRTLKFTKTSWIRFDIWLSEDAADIVDDAIATPIICDIFWHINESKHSSMTQKKTVHTHTYTRTSINADKRIALEAKFNELNVHMKMRGDGGDRF